MIALTLLAWVGVARADLPPPPDFVEVCTPAVCPQGAGVSCEGSFEGRVACEALEARGYVASCRTSGASVWTEVMCPAALSAPAPAAPNAPPMPAPMAPAAGGCVTAPAAGVGAWWLALGIVLARRRRA